MSGGVFPKMHTKNMLLFRIISCRNETSSWPLDLGAFKNNPSLEFLINPHEMGKTVLIKRVSTCGTGISSEIVVQF